MNSEITGEPTPSAGLSGHRHATLGDYIRLLRPQQWVKNLAVFAGPAFALRLLDLGALVNSLLAFASFCFVASASYALNDTMDRQADARHPEKRHRPVASGAIRPAAALGLTVLLFIAGIALSLLLPPKVTLLVAVYFAMIVAYSVSLKRRVILDVILIATGFVLRAIAGAEAVPVTVSPWLIVCTFTVCMFLGFGKRRSELSLFGTAEDAQGHRSTLLRYTPTLLTHLTSVTGGIAIMTFILYTLDPAFDAPFPKERLLYTLPLVVYGIFRYAMLSESGNLQGPTEVLLQDRPFLYNVLLWVLVVFLLIYAEQLPH